MAETDPRFVCPGDHGPLNRVGDSLLCDHCRIGYPIVNGVPILLHEENSLFRIADYGSGLSYGGASTHGGALDHTGGLRRLYHRSMLAISGRFIGRHKFSVLDALDHVRSALPTPDILVIGAGDATFATENVTYTDVAFGKNVSAIYDAHDLPFADASLDMVIAISVLEHVVDPYRCVDEIRRVLRPGGFIYAATPFLQPVHMGAHDFTRFTYLGHRRLFRHFDDIRSGTTGGPGNALAHLFRAALLSLSDSRRTRSVLRMIGHLLAVPISYTDFILDRRLASYDAAWSCFFFGTLRETPISDRDLLALFRGA